MARVGGLICWENMMPLARFALYEQGLEIHLAPTGDDSGQWLDSMRHVAREAGSFVLQCCAYQRACSYPDDVLEPLPPDQFMAAFTRLGLRAGVAPPQPPEGPPPPWMAKRPAGIRAFLTTFKSYPLDRDALRRFRRPVYFALGGLSNPDQYDEIAKRLADVFPDFTLEIFEQRHHFDPPHRVEPDRLAASLLRTWARAEAALPAGATTAD